MRIVELRLAGGPDLRLHPAVNVIRGFDADLREGIVAAAVALARGVVSAGAGGVIDVHGVLVDVSAESLRTLGLGEHDIDPLLRSDDLPLPAARGHEGAAAEAARRAEEVEELTARVEEARTAVDAAGRRPEPQGSEHGDVPARRLEEARAALAAARGRREAAEANARDVEAAAAGIAAERQRLAQAAEAVQAEADRPAPSTAGVEAALSALEARRSEPPPSNSEAEALAAAITDAVAALDDAVRRRAERDAAQDRVAAAREAFEEVQRQVTPLVLEPADVQALEEAHEAREDAERRAGRGLLASPMARRRLKQARQAEEAILARLELPSYSAYLMRSSTMHVGRDVQRQLAEASARVREAEDELRSVALAGEPSDDELAEQLRHHLARAAELAGRSLGSDPQAVAAALRELEPHPPDVAAEVHALGEALAAAGVEPPSHGNAEALADIARRWLDDAGRHDDRQEERRRRLADIEAERAALPDAPADRAAADAELERARQDEDEARLAVERARDAVEASASAASEAARRQEQEARDELARLTEALAAARGAAEAAGVAAEREAQAGEHRELQVYLLARLAALRAVGCAGPAPVVLDRPLAGASDARAAAVFEILSEAGGRFQLVVVDDDGRCAAWAEALGPRGAAVLSP